MGKHEEDRSAALAAFALGAVAERIDLPGAGDSRPDFALVFPDEHREPLEITAHADHVRQQSRERMRDHLYPAPGLSRHWALDVEAVVQGAAGNKLPIDVRRILAESPPLLRMLEIAVIQQFDEMLLYTPDTSVRQAARALRGLGIRRAFASDPLDDQIRLSISSGYGGAVHADQVAEAVEAEARKPDNLRKLAEIADAPRRHLFVTPATSGGLALNALHEIIYGRDERLPRLPTLPAPVTTVWAALGSGAIFVTPPDGWQIVRTPDGFWDGPYRDFVRERPQSRHI